MNILLMSTSGMKLSRGLKPLDNKKGRPFERPLIIITIWITGTVYKLPEKIHGYLNQARRQRDSS
jgi:hypothetical protein